jgi:hypothetical protein
MVRHLLVLASAMALALLFALVGVLLDIFTTAKLLKDGDVHSGIGVTGGLIAFVVLWYGYIRNDRPVWQPGRRFWVRWAWLTGLGYPLIMMEASFFPIVLALGLANLAYFIFDAFRCRGEYRVTPATRQRG